MWRGFEMMSSRHLGQYKGNFYVMDEVLIASLPATKGPSYKDAFFKTFRFQINPR